MVKRIQTPSPEVQVTSDQIRPEQRRRLRNKAARQLLSWNHFKLKELFEKTAKAMTAAGNPRRVIIVNESYTSRGCYSCGNIEENVGRYFVCSKCGDEGHRDLHAAKGILIRYLLVTVGHKHTTVKAWLKLLEKHCEPTFFKKLKDKYDPPPDTQNDAVSNATCAIPPN